MTCCARSWAKHTTAFVALALCAGLARADILPRDDIVTTATPRHFSVCTATAAANSPYRLSDAQWAISRHCSCRRPDRPGARRLPPAIALFERYPAAPAPGATAAALQRRPCRWTASTSPSNHRLLRAVARPGPYTFPTIADRATAAGSCSAGPHHRSAARTPPTRRMGVDGGSWTTASRPSCCPATWKAGWRHSRIDLRPPGARRRATRTTPLTSRTPPSPAPHPPAAGP